MSKEMSDVEQEEAVASKKKQQQEAARSDTRNDRKKQEEARKEAIIHCLLNSQCSSCDCRHSIMMMGRKQQAKEKGNPMKK